MSETSKTNEKNNAPKPEWLKKLEEESWQAELALSGAAIFITLQVPELFDWIEGKLMLNLSDSNLYLLDFIIPLFYITNLSLPILFFIHLSVRALWIGLVGENLLTVITKYPHPDTGEPREAHIPFYYTPMN